MPKLTEKFAAGFAPEPGAKDRLAFDTETKGLGLRATASGNKVFLVQWTDPATKRKVREPLGAWGSISVEQARAAAKARLGRVAAGFDPKAEREARKAEEARRRAEAARAKAEAAFTLETLIADWERLHLAARRPRYAAEATRALRLAFKPHLDGAASALTHEAVVGVLDDLARQGKAATARLTLAYGRACYGWAVKRRRLAVNPFAGLPAMEGRTTARDRVLTDAELGEVWRASGKVPSPHGPMIRLALLTLARRDEVAGMTWGEVAPDLSTWTQPASRTKNGKPHVVHLSHAARTLLRDILGAEDGKKTPPLPAADRLVFGVGDNNAITAHSWAKRKLDAAIAAERKEAACDGEAAPMAPWVLHDFRRSGVTWLAGAGFAPHVCDRLLNHISGTISGVAAVYQRNEFLPERKAALDAWAEHVRQSAESSTESLPRKVTRLADRRRR
ncbi:tyrosine-type recombinase/integrase [Falsiroseomonas oryziterrae]|uniref:tyrosine-type recombinase/integrase n=1 Tax=Falsiroseomonas oryziterrae TaxID=2911368 RepID=UPI001F375A5C|nr:site-specific integrase [Roseomonas sp. NPKOSM-4]